MIFPFMKALKIVATHDQSKNMLGIFFAQMRQGIYGKGRLRKPELYVTGTQLRIVPDRQMNHMKSFIIGSKIAAFFKWIQWRHNEPYLIQVRPIGHMIGDDHM